MGTLRGKGVLIGCLYLPNGNPAPGPKFDYKLAWFDRLFDHAAALLATGAPVMLVGDFNVMPTELDVYKPERWVDDALFRPEVRRAYQRLLDQGWTDAIRSRHPGERIYTFWDYLRNAWDRNAGLRLAHLLLSPTLKDQLRYANGHHTIHRVGRRLRQFLKEPGRLPGEVFLRRLRFQIAEIKATLLTACDPRNLVSTTGGQIAGCPRDAAFQSLLAAAQSQRPRMDVAPVICQRQNRVPVP